MAHLCACSFGDKEAIEKFGQADKPTVSVSNPVAVEGNSLTFSISLSRSYSHAITVHYTTRDGTATAGSDYTAASGTLEFAPGQTGKTVTVATLADGSAETDETVTFDIISGVNISKAYDGSGLIYNGGTPTVSVANTSVVEGGTMSFTVTLSVMSASTVTLYYVASDGTALLPGDYPNTSGVVTFASGQLTRTVTVPTVADTAVEGDETLNLTLFGGENYQAAGSTLTAEGTIEDNDTVPTVTISPVTAAEGDSLAFQVQLSNPYHFAVTVDYSTADGTATTGDSDYTAVAGTLTFTPDETSKTITVSATEDTHYEVDEDLTVALSGGGNYAAAGSTLAATGTITNDDSRPTVAVADVSAAEGSALAFAVTLSNRSWEVVTVSYATANGTATTGDSDYTGASGTVTFFAGDVAETVSVSTTADTKYEADETITTTLSGGANYTAAGSDLSATGTITNDDAFPTLSIGNATAEENGSLVFTVTQSRTSYLATTFDYATASGTATNGTDYTSTSGSGSIPAGSTTTTITVPATDDALDEADETFTTTISNPANAAITSAAGTGTITDTALFFSFLGGALPAGTTFSRASAGSYVDASGNVASAGSNTARFDHDPVTLAARGLLLEPAATNLLLNSEALDNWTATNLRATAANGGDSASPDGVNSNAELIRENGATTTHTLSQAVGTAVTAGALVHFTVYAKPPAANARDHFAVTVGNAASTNFIRAHFDLTGANAPTTASGGNGGGQLVAEVQDAGNGWKRVRLSGVASTTSTALTVTLHLQSSFAGGFSYNGDNASGINFWGAQLEEGNPVPTSYIATSGGTVTRAADLLYATSFTGFAGAFGDGSAWTLISDFSRPWYEPTTTAATVRAAEFCVAASCANDRISTVLRTGTRDWGTESVVGGATQGASLTGAIAGTSHAVAQLGVVKSAGTLRTYRNGTAYAATGALSYPSPDILYLGSSGYAGASLTGHLRKLTLRPRSMTNANMLTLTSD